jgi:hypothetical protein
MGIGQKQDKMLRYVAKRSSPGSWAEVDSEFDYPLIDARSGDEFTFLAEDLERDGYLDRQCDRNRTTALKLTVKGWKLIEPLAGGRGIPGHCFVAMPFNSSLNEAYELGVKPAIEKDCGFRAIRIDLVEHNEKICDKIIAEIRRAQFMVADCTYQRLNVYFEAGFALGLGRTVIWMCREDEFDKLKDSFDTRQYNHVKWSSPEDLRKQLANRILATIPR